VPAPPEVVIEYLPKFLLSQKKQPPMGAVLKKNGGANVQPANGNLQPNLVRKTY
jgi:hypothetical protein